MPETIRERQKRRARAIFVFLVGGFLLLGFAAYRGYIASSASDAKKAAPYVALGGVVFMGAVFASIVLLACPKCGTQFDKAGRGFADVAGWRKRKIETCERCGVSFDDPWP